MAKHLPKVFHCNYYTSNVCSCQEHLFDKMVFQHTAQSPCDTFIFFYSTDGLLTVPEFNDIIYLVTLISNGIEIVPFDIFCV